MDVAYLIRVQGRVTGVGFRFATYREATRYPGLKGYVHNASDREVEILVQGDKRDVDAFVSWTRQGPGMARVIDFKISDQPLSANLSAFTITY